MITGPAVSGREEGVWSDLRGDDRERPAYSRQDAERIIGSVTVGGVDARPRLRALTVPGLWLFGTDDNSIPTRKSVLVLDSLKSMGKRFHVDTFPGAGHVLFTRAGGLLPHVASRSWDSIDAWFAREVRAP